MRFNLKLFYCFLHPTFAIFRFVTKELTEEQSPEMLRCSISKLVLMAKELNCAEPKQLLGLALDPPKLHNIESTILNLKEVGYIEIFTSLSVAYLK